MLTFYGIYHRTKTAASLWEKKVLTYWWQEVGWSSPSIPTTFYQPELIAEPSFTLLSKDQATRRTRHILLYKICYRWHSTRYHLFFLIYSHVLWNTPFHSVNQCFPSVLDLLFWSSKIFYGWCSPYHLLFLFTVTFAGPLINVSSQFHISHAVPISVIVLFC